MGDLGLFGIPFPVEYGGGGVGLATLCVAIEELARVDQSMAVTLEAGVGLGANPIYRFGTEEQRQQWLPDLVAGRGPRRLRADRARRRQRRRRHPHQGGARRGHRRVGASTARRRSSPTPAAELTSVVTVTAVTGIDRRRRPEISAIVVPAGTPGFEVAAALSQDGLARLGHPRADLLGVPGARGQPARRAGPGLANFLAVLDDGRVAIAAVAVGVIEGCLEACVALRQRAHRLRAAHRHQPGHRLQVRGHGRDGRRRPGAHLRRGRPPRRRVGRSSRRRPWPSCTPPRPRSPPPARPPRSSAATASWTRRRWPASTATPRSSRSARAPARSSAW